MFHWWQGRSSKLQRIIESPKKTSSAPSAHLDGLPKHRRLKTEAEIRPPEFGRLAVNDNGLTSKLGAYAIARRERGVGAVTGMARPDGARIHLSHRLFDGIIRSRSKSVRQLLD
jgi:hypothetical protein